MLLGRLLGRSDVTERTPQEEVVCDLHRRSDDERREQHVVPHQRAGDRGRDRPARESYEVGDAARERALVGIDDGVRCQNKIV